MVIWAIGHLLLSFPPVVLQIGNKAAPTFERGWKGGVCVCDPPNDFQTGLRNVGVHEVGWIKLACSLCLGYFVERANADDKVTWKLSMIMDTKWIADSSAPRMSAI